jgi:hypothetical protein
LAARQAQFAGSLAIKFLRLWQAKPAVRSATVLANGHGHDVSQLHRRFSIGARTSMTSMFPWPQAGQSISDVPVRV